MAIADKALFGFNSMDDLWQQEIPRGEDEVILQWNESAKNLPILRNVTMKDGVTKDPMSKWTFRRIHRFTMRNAGYFCGISIHQIRRYLGKKIDGEWCLPGLNLLAHIYIRMSFADETSQRDTLRPSVPSI